MIDPLILAYLAGVIALDLWENLQEARDDDPYPWAPAGWDPTLTRDALRSDVIDLHTRRRIA